MQEFEANEQDSGERVDRYLAAHLPQLNRSIIKRFIEEGRVTINDQAVNKAGKTLQPGDNIILDFDLSEIEEIPDITLPIIYEDDDCIVIDKPIGVLTHSKGIFNPEGTVASFIAPKLDGLSGERAGIVHRLDRVTSGIIICGKNQAAMTHLQKQFSQRRTKKTYYAVVVGKPSPEEALIDIPIGRNPAKPKTFYGSEDGKSAKTLYKVLQSSDKYSLLELHPETGRTHQIRVHLSHHGHPIVGDTTYDGPADDRVYLHAGSLEITLPNKERTIFTSPLPAEFREKVGL